MKLVVGLGNPGKKYEETRHNIGFRVLEEFSSSRGFPGSKEKFSGLFSKGSFAGEELVLLWPQTFMNLSGKSVQAAAAFFKVSPKEIIVIHDELDLPFGDLKIKVGGGHAGHNGLRSLIECLGTPDFIRMRVGIGRGMHPNQDVADYVLSPFSALEKAELSLKIPAGSQLLELLLKEGASSAMNKGNQGKKKGNT